MDSRDLCKSKHNSCDKRDGNNNKKYLYIYMKYICICILQKYIYAWEPKVGLQLLHFRILRDV